MNAISYKITLRRGGPLFPGTGSRACRVRERPCMEADKGCVLHRPSSLWAWGRPWLASTTMSIPAAGPPCSKPAKPKSRLSIVQRHREAPKSQAPEPQRRGVWIPPPAQASLLISFLELSGNEMIAQKGYFPTCTPTWKMTLHTAVSVVHIIQLLCPFTLRTGPRPPHPAHPSFSVEPELSRTVSPRAGIGSG